MAGWYLGANMKPMLVCLMHSATPSGPRSTATPSASRTSADPHMDETDRLPCLATLAPAAAARMHEPVEMLTVPASSPPVPTMSRTSSPASTVTARARMARAMPAISSGDSPLARMRTRKAEICAGSASMRASSASSVSSAVRFSAAHRRSMTWRRSTARHRTAPPLVAGANRPSDNPSLDDRELCLIGETPRTFAARDAMRRGAATEARVIDTVEAIEAMVYRSRDVSSHLGTRL